MLKPRNRGAYTLVNRRSAISYIRNEKGISQIELAKKLNINRSYLSAIENNKMLPNYELMLEIARNLDCLITDLYRQDDIQNIGDI